MFSDLPGMPGIPDPQKMTTEERLGWMYDKMLSGFLGAVDKWAEISMDYHDESRSAESVISDFDTFMAQKGMLLLVLKDIRDAEKRQNIDSQVASFREQLDGFRGIPEQRDGDDN